MMLYSSSSTVNTSLAIGSTSAFMQVVGGIPAWVTAPIVADDTFIKYGNDGDSVILNRSSSLSANAEVSNVIEGTSVHPGVAANSLIISNVTNDGDIMFLVSDGGNSKGLLKLKASDGTIAIAGDLTSAGGLTLTPTTDTFLSNGTGLVVGHTAQETISAGDGATDMVPEVQILGTAGADSSILVAAFSNTATIAAAPTIHLVKGGHASIGSHAVVTDDEVLGALIFGGDDGTDLESIGAWIKAEVDGSPGTGDLPTRIIMGTSADGAEVPTTRLTIDSGGDVIVAGELDAATLDISGNADIDGTLETDALTIGGAAVLAQATASAVGAVELATSAEINTSTDASRVITPDAFAASNYGLRYVALSVGDPSTAMTTGNNKAKFHIPAGLNGMDLVEVHAEVSTAPAGSTADIQLSRNGSADMLSTKITIDASETGSDTAAAAAVINGSNDNVSTNDTIQIDIDQIGSSTAGSGLVVTMGFRIP